MSTGTPLSGSLASMFQTAFNTSLSRRNTLGTSNALASLALNTAIPGSNPLNPLQGVPAVTGLAAFVAQIQQTAALRKAGLLPPTGSAAAAQSTNQLTQLLGTLTSSLAGGGGLGGLGGLDPTALLSTLTASLGSLGAAAPAPAAADLAPSGTAGSADVAGTGLAGTNLASLPSGASALPNGLSSQSISLQATQLLSQMQSMFTQMQALMAQLTGQQQAFAGTLGGVSPLATSGLPQSFSTSQLTSFPQTIGANQLFNTPQSTLGALPQQTLGVPQQQLGGVGASGLSPLVTGGTGVTGGLGQQQLFPQTVNFNAIDSAINQTLGGIFSTLPLVKI